LDIKRGTLLVYGIYMKRPDPTEQALEQLRAAKAEELPKFLKNRSHRVVAKAAEMAVREMAVGALGDLVEAFRRLLPGGSKQDPGCVAKLAIVKALVELEDASAEVFFAGARHVQMEASWGPPVDTAAEMRGICAIGLARMGHPDALIEAVRLLSDDVADARIGALRALADSGRTDAELVLRYKADCGDEKPEVMGECFGALLRLGPKARAVPFVTEFMGGGSEEAAIALGESRMAEAWPVLRDAFEGSRIQSAILLGMSLLRNDEAIEFLLGQVEHGRERAAAVAVEVLGSYRGDGALRARMEGLVGRRKSAVLEKVFGDSWGDG
jgi:HEAT repeat protein